MRKTHGHRRSSKVLSTAKVCFPRCRCGFQRKPAKGSTATGRLSRRFGSDPITARIPDPSSSCAVPAQSLTFTLPGLGSTGAERGGRTRGAGRRSEATGVRRRRAGPHPCVAPGPGGGCGTLPVPGRCPTLISAASGRRAEMRSSSRSWVAGSSADVASSMTMMSGRWMKSCAKASRCCSPPESVRSHGTSASWIRSTRCSRPRIRQGLSDILVGQALHRVGVGDGPLEVPIGT